MVGRAGEKPLYQVLEQQAAPVGNALMGSDHTYVIPGAGAPAAGAPTKGAAAAAAKRCAALAWPPSLIPQPFFDLSFCRCRWHVSRLLFCGLNWCAALHQSLFMARAPCLSIVAQWELNGNLSSVVMSCDVRWCRSGIAPGDVEVAIDPAELEGLDEAGVRALYEERLSQQRTASSREVPFCICLIFSRNDLLDPVSVVISSPG